MFQLYSCYEIHRRRNLTSYQIVLRTNYHKLKSLSETNENTDIKYVPGWLNIQLKQGIISEKSVIKDIEYIPGRLYI